MKVNGDRVGQGNGPFVLITVILRYVDYAVHGEFSNDSTATLPDLGKKKYTWLKFPKFRSVRLSLSLSFSLAHFTHSALNLQRDTSSPVSQFLKHVAALKSPK